MSESLKSWLFSHTSSSAILSLENNYDLSDLPYVRGNRVQLLRFLTFRPPASPNSHNTDVWALVGDRSHCIAARFAREQVNRFHKDHDLTFTSLKGALLTLTHVRTSVSRVQVEQSPGVATTAGGGPYRQGQYAVILDVKGWQVVSSVNEPVWFAGVKVITSTNGFPEGEEERGRQMLGWLKKWVRYKCLMRRAKVEQRERQRQRERLQADAGEGGDESASTNLPTPAQRRAVLVLSSSQVQNTQPLHLPIPPQQAGEKTTSQDSESLPSTTCRSMGPSSSSAAAAAALWEDFDLDFIAVNDDVDAVDVPGQWSEAVLHPSTEPSTTAVPVVDEEAQESTQAASNLAQEESQSQTQTHTQTQSDLDPYESGLSDYERNTRLARYRLRHPPNPPFPSSSPINPNETSAQRVDRHRELLHPTFEPWKARRLELGLSTSHSAYLSHLNEEAERFAEAYEADEIFKAACERSSSEERAEEEEAADAMRRAIGREARLRRFAAIEKQKEERAEIGRSEGTKNVVQGEGGEVRQFEMEVMDETVSTVVANGEKDIPSQMLPPSRSPAALAKTNTSAQHNNKTPQTFGESSTKAQSLVDQHLPESALPPPSATHNTPPKAHNQHPQPEPRSIPPSSPSTSSTPSKRSSVKKRKRNHDALAAL
ncbi:uncharacterized protein UTRI_05238_B [Ustilago trichophora]|uniref:Uncharacterized protein n=1 Tax=Ustilago trichophora TaxID=86804 RepID=A0A5C3ELZ2_9BASI|nr:uncharacterized protein UTRI_05238_B [Ustilago trichophora]